MTGPDLYAHRIRAGIAAYLWDVGSADFTILAAEIGLKNNQISGHLARLEQAGFIELRRGFAGRKPRTVVALTPVGRRGWTDYLDRMA